MPTMSPLFYPLYPARNRKHATVILLRSFFLFATQSANASIKTQKLGKPLSGENFRYGNGKSCRYYAYNGKELVRLFEISFSLLPL